MEQKDIVFEKGIHREPSVSLSDAELSECVNLMPRHGELVNMKPAGVLDVHLETGEQLLAIHETSEYKHYITKYNGILHYIDKNSLTTHVSLSVSAANIKQVVAVGNALALIYEQSVIIPMKYLLWRDSSYTTMEEIPTMPIDFTLSGDYFQVTYPNSVKFEEGSASSFDQEAATITYSGSTTDVYEKTNEDFTALGLEVRKYYQVTNNTKIGDYEEDVVLYYNDKSILINYGESKIIKFSKPSIGIRAVGGGVASSYNVIVVFKKSSTDDTPLSTVLAKGEENYSAMMGDVKNYIKRVYKNKNQFIFPFFIRYAIKLFDGSYCHLSEPVYMLPNSGVSPVIIKSGESTMVCAAYAASLKAFIQNGIITNDFINKWKDIITGVAVAITSPIYRVNIGEEYDEYKSQGECQQYSEANLSNNYGILNGDKKNIYADINDSVSNRSLLYFPPSFTQEQFENNIKSTNVFYIVKTYTLKELQSLTTAQSIDLSSVSLDNVATLPTLPDDYNSANKFYPTGGFSYNNRLNIYGIKETLAKPVTPVSPILNVTASTTYRYIFYISDMGRELIVKSDEWTGEPFIRWIYYGNTKATKCRVYKNTSGSYQYIDFPMSIHPWLNGAYIYTEEDYSGKWQNGNAAGYNPTIEADSNLINNANAIYASNASNPFYFAVANQNIIGTGKIKAVSTAAKALSQGQFGQFPLYAFTDDGIWSLSVDGEGKYSTSNPVNRDVVANPESICQIDDSVIYACSQGLKQLTGSEAKLLTGAIDGHNVDESLFFGKDTSRTDISSLDSDHSGLVVADTDSMIHLAENCMVMYDPSGQRLLHVYPKTPNGKHYVYDLDSGEWSCEVGDSSKVKSVVPGYPYSTFVAPVKDEAGVEHDKLMQYTNAEHNNVTRYGVLLTRAYAMGDPFAMKMLRDIRLIYTKNNATYPAKCKVAVFASNDRVKWKQLKSLRKHSYKWYRFRIQTAMTDLDALTSISMQVEERRTNKMR